MDPALEQTVCLLATEWWKCSRRLERLTYEAAPTRVERERAQLAYSERAIAASLQTLDVQMRAYDGQVFSASLAVEPVNPEDFAAEEALEIGETLEPTILCGGHIIRRGKVVLRRTEIGA